VLVKVQVAAEVLVGVQAAAVAAAKASVVVKVEKEEWVEERWGLKENVSVPSAAPNLPIREQFLVSSRNAPSVEPLWYAHNRKVI
jgi:hypothetical protein